jgi:hypothetical protein
VKCLRQRGEYDIPAPAGRSCKEVPKQEVVRLEFNKNPASVIEAFVAMYGDSYPPQTLTLPVMELLIEKVILRISNGINPILLAQTLKALKELAC